MLGIEAQKAKVKKKQYDEILKKIGSYVSKDGIVEFRQCEVAGIDDNDSEQGKKLGQMLANIIKRQVWLYNDTVAVGVTLENPSKFKPE